MYPSDPATLSGPVYGGHRHLRLALLPTGDATVPGTTCSVYCTNGLPQDVPTRVVSAPLAPLFWVGVDSQADGLGSSFKKRCSCNVCIGTVSARVCSRVRRVYQPHWVQLCSELSGLPCRYFWHAETCSILGVFRCCVRRVRRFPFRMSTSLTLATSEFEDH